MTKEEWLQRCADRYVKAAGLRQETADESAKALWDSVLDDEGSVAAVLAMRSPEDEADEEMQWWEPA